MKFERRFSHADGPYADLKFSPRNVRVSDFRTGKVTFEAIGVPFPETWGKLASDILAKSYIRRAGVPKFTKRVPEAGVPSWLQRSVPDDDKLSSLPESERFGMETDSRQVFGRLAGCWTYWAWKSNYFASEEDARIYHDEMCAMLANQMAAPNSPQWFNTGLHWAYGITGNPQGHWYVDPYTKEITQATNAYEHCMPHACFIQSVSDDLVNPGGIIDLVLREALVFKFGAGSGSNFRRVRGKGEPLSGGGTSSGLMSFLRVHDRGAGATKSGGTTRRAAKMVIVPLDHPEVLDFIHWKAREESKVAMIVAGSVVLRRYLADIMSAAHDDSIPSEARLSPVLNPKLRAALQAATKAGVPPGTAKQALDYAAQGFTTIDIETFNTDWDSDGYGTVSGQNSNNTVRVPNRFFKALDNDEKWDLIRRTDGGVDASYPARDIFQQIGDAAWKSADPGIQYDDTINEWNTCSNDGRIEGSNPCVTADTLMSTADGHKRIGNLVGKSAFVIGSDGKPHFVSKIFPTGTKPVYELTTKAGYSLKLTADHKVFTINRGDIPASELAHDDELALVGGGFGSAVLTPELATFVGEEVRNAHARKRAVSSTAQSRSAKTNQLGLLDGSQCEALLFFTSLSGEWFVDKFTDAAFSLDRDSTISLLTSIFACNAGENDAAKAEFHSATDELLRQVQLLLLSLGVKAEIQREPKSEFGKLRIAASSSSRFDEIFGTDHSKDIESTLAAQSSSHYQITDGFAALVPLGEQPVFDLTESDTHHFVANGLVVHNCSEYLFLDDTACNLASINLGKFYRDESAEFDAEAFRYACRLWTFTLDVSVTMAQFPTKLVAERSYDYRTLGLGYANLGSLLMRMGHAYDSVDGYRWCAAITALMTGAATEMSAEMAVELGAFPRYKHNEYPMLRVMENHRRAAHSVPDSEYEGLTIKPVTHEPDLLTQRVWGLARAAWDESLRLGRIGGWRNAQATVIAPTGTIALVMQCDTTGIEPNFAVVMFKQLAGGGAVKIVNESIAPALRQLGYSVAQIREIDEYIKGVPTLETVPHINRMSLRSKGFDDAGIAKVEAALASTMEIESAFSTFVLGADYYSNVLKVDASKSADPRFSLLRDHFCFTTEQIREASLIACGRHTIEGAPYVREDHLPVFDCATECGELGKRFIRPLAHVDMMAAAQPFLSGAISKTINMPGSATINDILDAYRYAWERGTKAVAVYRNGSKLSQPLNSSFDFVGFEGPADEVEGKAFISPTEVVRQIVYRYIAKERSLPNRRRGLHQKVTIGGQKLIISTGEYEDGNLGEIYINTHKDGTAMRAMLNNFAIAVSTALQYGVPLEKLVDTFTFTDFMPKGPVVGDDHIKNATSIIDYIFRMLAVTYLNRWDLAHVEPSLAKAIPRDAEFTSEADGPIQRLSHTEVAMETVLRPVSTRMSTPTVEPPIKALAVEAARNGNGHAVLSATAVAEPAVGLIESAKSRESAINLGFTGAFCNSCGSNEMKRTGTCVTCMKCGANDGCA